MFIINFRASSTSKTYRLAQVFLIVMPELVLHMKSRLYFFLVAAIIHDVESRNKWDKLFPVIEVLETHEHYRVVYW